MLPRILPWSSQSHKVQPSSLIRSWPTHLRSWTVQPCKAQVLLRLDGYASEIINVIIVYALRNRPGAFAPPPRCRPLTEKWISQVQRFSGKSKRKRPSYEFEKKLWILRVFLLSFKFYGKNAEILLRLFVPPKFRPNVGFLKACSLPLRH